MYERISGCFINIKPRNNQLKAVTCFCHCSKGN